MLLVLSLSGCWNYKDINELFVVIGVAVDKDTDTGEYIISYEVAKAVGDTEMKIRVSTTRGDTLYDAIRNAIHEMGTKLYWGHTAIWFIGKNIAEEGILPVMDTISRATQIKPNVLICYSDIDNLEDLFKSDEPHIHNSVSGHIVDLFEHSAASGKFISSPMIEVSKQLTTKFSSVLLPYFEIVKHDEEKALIVNGSAAFKSDKYLCRLDEIETRSVNILKGKELKKSYIISHRSAAFPYLSVEVMSSKIKIEPILEDNEIRIDIEFDIKCKLVEIDVSDALNLENIESGIKSSIREMLVNQFGSIIKRAQKVEKTDIFGFGSHVYRKHPNYYKTVENSWDKTFENMKYNISVNMEIESSGAIRQPLELGD